MRSLSSMNCGEIFLGVNIAQPAFIGQHGDNIALMCGQHAPASYISLETQQIRPEPPIEKGRRAAHCSRHLRSGEIGALAPGAVQASQQ